MGARVEGILKGKFFSGYTKGSDPVEKFYPDVYPYLYSAFRGWRDVVMARGNNTVRRGVDPKTNTFSAIIDASASGFLALGNGIFDEREVGESFKVGIGDFRMPRTLKQAKEGVFAWQELLRRDTWLEVAENVPLVARLTESPLCLPKEIAIDIEGGKIIAVFGGRYYFPNVPLGARNVALLYEAIISREYKEISDFEFKRLVLDILVREVSKDGRDGCCLDIGSGSGFAAICYPERKASFFGVDLSGEMVFQSIANGERAICGNIAELETEFFEREGVKFDSAIMAFADNYLSNEEREKTYALVFSLLPKGGRFAFNTYHPNELTSEEYFQLLKDAGFSEVKAFDKKIKSVTGRKKVTFIMAQK